MGELQSQISEEKALVLLENHREAITLRNGLMRLRQDIYICGQKTRIYIYSDGRIRVFGAENPFLAEHVASCLSANIGLEAKEGQELYGLVGSVYCFGLFIILPPWGEGEIILDNDFSQSIIGQMVKVRVEAMPKNRRLLLSLAEDAAMIT